MRAQREVTLLRRKPNCHNVKDYSLWRNEGTEIGGEEDIRGKVGGGGGWGDNGVEGLDGCFVSDKMCFRFNKLKHSFLYTHFTQPQRRRRGTQNIEVHIVYVREVT